MKSKITKITLISAICIVLIFLLFKYDTEQILALCTLGLFISAQIDEIIATVPKIKKKKENIAMCDFCENIVPEMKIDESPCLCIKDNKIQVYFHGLDDVFYEINYCPMCGRKLVEE